MEKQEKKKILHLVESFGSGVFTFLVDLVNSTDKEFDIVIAYGVREETLENFKEYFSDRVKFIKVDNFTRSINPKKDLKAIKEVKKIVKQIKPDIVHMHSSKAGAVGRIAISAKNRKLIYNPHGFSFLKQDDSKMKRFIYKAIEKILTFRKCTIVGCSQGEYEEAKKLSKNSICINNGINIEKLKEETQGLEPKEIDYKNLKVCTSGRIGYQKNPELFNGIAEKLPNIKFTWIGDGELRDKLTSKNITITGLKERKEVLKILNDNDIFILTSLWEGLPISLLEAMYMKKLCIVSNCIGNRDVIKNGKNGYIADTVKEYVKEIVDFNKFDLMEKAKQDIINKYNLENMINKYTNLYGINHKKDKIKVLQYTERWGTGGIEAFIMNLYRNIDVKKVEMDILTSQNESDIYDEEIKKYNGNKISTLEELYSSPIKRMINNLKVFRKKIKNLDYDCIHLNIGNGVSLIYAYLAKKEGIKRIIVHSHNTGIKKENYGLKILGHKICKKIFSGYATDYIACSDKAAEWLYPKKYQNKVVIINNGIDTKKYKFDNKKREQLRKELEIENKLVIGNIGRFTEQKNHIFLIDVFYEICKKNNNSILLLVGEGELEEKIREKVNKLNIGKNVIFFGTTNDVPTVLSAMDIFVLPSLYEGNPVVGIEAQASGLKCFFSDSITKQAKVTSNVCYVPLESKCEEWGKQILECNINIDNRDKCAEMVKTSGFDIKDVAEKMEKIYLMGS